MIFITAGLLFALAMTVLAFSNLLRSQQRAHTRERDLLLDKLLHVAGRPWGIAPADESRPAPVPREPAAPRFTADPAAFEHALPLGDLEALEATDLSRLIPTDWK